MLREIIEAKSESYTIQIPKEYLHSRVEILVLPFDEPKEPKGSKLELLRRGPTLAPPEVAAWEEAIEKGYENWKID